MAGGLRVAIMQPYFAPYAGYFRLLAASDLFVVYDCVQFPRRGWLHRNRLPDAKGEPDWLTLPLAKAPQDVLIRDLRYRDDAPSAMAEQARRFPDLAPAIGPFEPIRRLALEPTGTPVDHIVTLLEACARLLGLPWRTVRSSSLAIPSNLHGQDRILAIAAAVGAGHYVNAPGGRDLYDRQRFAEAGMALDFLTDYPGPTASILARLAHEEPAAVAREIRDATMLAP